ARKVRFTSLIRTMSLWTRHCSLDCNKKVNHEMPAERFSSSLAPKYRAHFVSAPSWTRLRVKKQAQNGDKIDAAKKAQTTTLSICYTLAGAGDSNLRMAESKSANSFRQGPPLSDKALLSRCISLTYPRRDLTLAVSVTGPG